MPKNMTRANIAAFYETLSQVKPAPDTELTYHDPYTLLVAVTLSAQATDVGVNKATARLFPVADTPQKMVALGEEKLGEHIRTIGLWRNKAKNVIKLSQMLIDEHGGVVPQDRDELQKLPGVGRKTANVVCNVAFGQPNIAVDTHIFRVSNRTGLARGKDVLAVEQRLEKVTPSEYLLHAHHWLILHGRYICKAMGDPECWRCPVRDLCLYTPKTPEGGFPKSKKATSVKAPKKKKSMRKKPPPEGSWKNKSKGVTCMTKQAPDLIDRLIVPLDVATPEEAETTVALLGDAARFYKIGYQLMPVGGSELARRLLNKGKKVFLDFKFLDIGATVEKGVASAARLGGDFITIHADPDALAGAIQGRGSNERLKILAVTVLTSWNTDTLKAYKIDMSVHDLVLYRAEMAANAGVDGIVASAQEAASIRARFGHDLTIVTPGIRPKGASANDQKRVVAPAEAIRAGSDHLVIGRPILNAPNPKDAVRVVMEEMTAALAEGEAAG